MERTSCLRGVSWNSAFTRESISERVNEENFLLIRIIHARNSEYHYLGSHSATSLKLYSSKSIKARNLPHDATSFDTASSDDSRILNRILVIVLKIRLISVPACSEIHSACENCQIQLSIINRIWLTCNSGVIKVLRTLSTR